MRARALVLALMAGAGLVLAGCGGTVTANSLEGRVVDGSNLPLINAQVVTGGQTVYTDGSGYFRFAGVTPGSHVVVGVYSGYQIAPVIVSVGTGVTTCTLVAVRVSQPPSLNVAIDKPSLPYFGGTVVVTATAQSALGHALTVTGVDDLGSVAFVVGTLPNTWTATVTLPGNSSTLARDYSFVVTASDGTQSNQVVSKVTVAGVPVPGGVGGGTTPGGGGPPIPNIR